MKLDWLLGFMLAKVYLAEFIYNNDAEALMNVHKPLLQPI